MIRVRGFPVALAILFLFATGCARFSPPVEDGGVNELESLGEFYNAAVIAIKDAKDDGLLTGDQLEDLKVTADEFFAKYGESQELLQRFAEAREARTNAVTQKEVDAANAACSTIYAELIEKMKDLRAEFNDSTRRETEG